MDRHWYILRVECGLVWWRPTMIRGHGDLETREPKYLRHVLLRGAYPE